ncbi:MAG: Na+/H+ antiporter subunit E [Bacteroidota bacterium]|nr:Na+/H+ antiporter subunit E [Bacteroidota bacterium]
MKLKAISIMFFVLMVVWMILNNSLAIEIWLTGGVVSLFLALLLCGHCGVFQGVNLTPKALLYTVVYLFVFLFELVKSNVLIALMVLTPSLPINPGVIRVKTVLKSKMARLILANSITLTPGTFTIDLIDDTLYIHCVDLEGEDHEAYAKSIIRKFEKYLEVIYG